MASNRASFIEVQRTLQGLAAVLSAAACEWFLIFLLLIDAALSYFLTKFARYCELQTPCLLCSRLDHVFDNEKSEFYWSLLCSDHRLEISSLINCHMHGKLAYSCGMCEQCLLSCAPDKNFNAERYKVLEGKVGMDSVGSGFQSSLLKRGYSPGPMGPKLCSCCNKPWRSRQNSHRLLQLQSIASAVSKPNVPLPRQNRNRLCHRENIKKIRGRISDPVISQCIGKSGIDPLAYVGYTELKLTSDSDTEFPFSDDDGCKHKAHYKSDPTKDFAVQCALDIKSKTPSSDVDLAEVVQKSSNSRASLLDSRVEPDVRETHHAKCLEPELSIMHGLSELNHHQADQKSKNAVVPELISLDDISSFSSSVDVPLGLSTSKYKHTFPFSQNLYPSVFSELIALNGTTQSSGSSHEKKVTGSIDFGHTSIIRHGEDLESANKTGFKDDQASTDSVPIKPIYVHPNNEHKLMANYKGREGSHFVVEPSASNDPAKFNEDLKLLPLQPTSAQGIHSLLKNSSSQVQCHADVLQITDTSISNEIQRFQDSLSMDKSESGLESMEGSAVSEIDGESVVDRLIRQVEYDRKRISMLYKELEEERSASAVAANQAMAMITRLQEEKAALHMEALQYLRMMEEQAEYDMEALEKATDLLAEKEKELQDMEAELEFYRFNVSEELMVENTHGSSEFKVGNMATGNTVVLCVKNNDHLQRNKISDEVTKSSVKPVSETSWLEFQDEKAYISQCLKSLEKRLHLISHDGALSNKLDTDHKYSENSTNGGEKQKELLNHKGIQLNSHMEESGASMEVVPIFGGSTTAKEVTISLADDDCSLSHDSHLDTNGHKKSMHMTEYEWVALENEFSDLNDRLESLEDNYGFLEHTLNSLQNGNEGLKFVEEIAHQLQELRKIGIRSRSQSIS